MDILLRKIQEDRFVNVDLDIRWYKGLDQSGTFTLAGDNVLVSEGLNNIDFGLHIVLFYPVFL